MKTGQLRLPRFLVNVILSRSKGGEGSSYFLPDTRYILSFEMTELSFSCFAKIAARSSAGMSPIETPLAEPE